MIRRAIFLALAVVLWGCGGTPRPAPPSIPPAGLSAESAEVVRLVNVERARAKLPPLSVDARLTGAAVWQARDLSLRGAITHTGSDGSSPWDRMTAAGYRWANAGENAALGQYTPEAVARDWMSSPGHRANILGPYTQCGVGHAVGVRHQYHYWVMTFATPIPAGTR